jgi:hypothetical protein
MKAYLFVTGILFGLMALLHLLKGIDERAQLHSEPGHYIFMAALGVLAAALSIWAWSLLRRVSKS